MYSIVCWTSNKSRQCILVLNSLKTDYNNQEKVSGFFLHVINYYVNSCVTFKYLPAITVLMHSYNKDIAEVL